MPSPAKAVHSLLRVDILWGPEVMAGAALAVVDVLHFINLVSAMRTPRVPDPVAWRWWCIGGGRAPRSLPQSAPCRGLADLVVVPGWHAQSGPHLEQIVARASPALARLEQVHAAGGLVAGLFNAAALLGEAGLLHGRCAVVPWAFVMPVRRHSAGVSLLTDRSWTVDDRIWTCDSPVLATEVMIDMLRHTPVAELAQSAAHVYLHSEARQQVSMQVVQGEQPRGLPAGALERARRWLEDHMTEPYSLTATAQAAATSARTLLRHFAGAYGQSPLDYLHSLRVARARVLLETTYVSVEQVAQMCGYQDTGTFRRLFARQTGEMPAAYRARYSLRTSRKRWVGSV
ncbi:MAG: helix-turn-helix domain-containing protein [Rhodoferax sp.]|nr:helix-turn-helix domain-containing protein [Rhodoferax sp.]MCF8209424.1 helix-turn-helix domain-containing protein [Rhodoferax sp.]